MLLPPTCLLVTDFVGFNRSVSNPETPTFIHSPPRTYTHTHTNPQNQTNQQVTDYPTGFRAGAPQEVTVQYNLLPGAEPSYVSASLLRNSDNSVVAHAQAKAEEGEHTAKLRFDVPMEAGTEPVHILATIKEEGKSFHARMAEDRVWSTSVYYARKNNLRG